VRPARDKFVAPAKAGKMIGNMGGVFFDTIPHTPLLVKKENIELANIGAHEHSLHFDGFWSHVASLTCRGVSTDLG
jgi:hypothetical protein